MKNFTESEKKDGYCIKKLVLKMKNRKFIEKFINSKDFWLRDNIIGTDVTDEGYIIIVKLTEAELKRLEQEIGERRIK